MNIGMVLSGVLPFIKSRLMKFVFITGLLFLSAPVFASLNCPEVFSQHETASLEALLEATRFESIKQNKFPEKIEDPHAQRHFNPGIRFYPGDAIWVADVEYIIEGLLGESNAMVYRENGSEKITLKNSPRFRRKNYFCSA